MKAQNRFAILSTSFLLAALPLCSGQQTVSRASTKNPAKDASVRTSIEVGRAPGLFAQTAAGASNRDVQHVVEESPSASIIDFAGNGYLAGTGSGGFSGDGGPATSAELYLLGEILNGGGLAFDAAGDLLFADVGNNRIRKVAAGTGIITTVAGGAVCNSIIPIALDSYCGDGGAATLASLYYPNGIALDASGDIFIADSLNDAVRRVDGKTGVITSYVGTPHCYEVVEGVGPTACSGQPGYTGDGGPATAAQLNYPSALALDSAGNLYIADERNNVVRKVNAKTGIITTVAGGGLGCTGQLNIRGDGCPATSAIIGYPLALAFDTSGNLYIGDDGNIDAGSIASVRVVNAATGIISTFAGGANGIGICASATDGAGDGCSATSSIIGMPSGLSFDAMGNLFVSDQLLDIVRRVDAQSGIITLAAGKYDTQGFSGVTAATAELTYPSDLTFDSAGHLYFADSGNNVIREVLYANLTSTSTTVTSDANPALLGAEVTFTAYVQPSPGPTGAVTFSVDGAAGTAVTLDGTGHASYATSSLAEGTHTIAAAYSGDANNANSSGSITENIIDPVSISAVSGSNQTSAQGTVFPQQLTVMVEDSNSNPVSGAVVTFSGAGLRFSANSAITGANGQAAVSATPTTTGDLTATASTIGINGTATFSLTATAPQALQFIPVTPCRIADTRNATGPFGGPGMTANQTRNFDIPESGCNIPSTAVAYSVNVTVVPNGALSYLTLWPTGQAQPYVSTLNSDGRVKANAAIVPAGTGGAISVFVTDPTQVILDIDGYFVPAGTASALAFYPVTPCRIADTRQAAAPLGGPYLTAGSVRTFPILSSSCGLPSSAQAYSLNVTALPHGTLGYLTTWPAGEQQPLVSTLNSSTGTVTANAAIVPAGASGDVSVFVTDDADVLLDVNGYFAAPASGGLALYTASPCRSLDTRFASGAFSNTIAVGIEASTCAPPADAQAFVLNATVVPSGPLAYLSLWPEGQNQPNVSTLNAYDAAVTSNMAIVPTTNGSIDAYFSDPGNLILDISSYFALDADAQANARTTNRTRQISPRESSRDSPQPTAQQKP